MRNLFFKVALFILILPAIALAQNPTKWRLESDAKGKPVKKDETFKVNLKAEVEPGWHLYALDQPSGGPIATTIKIAEGIPFAISGDINSPQPKIQADPNFIIDGKALDTKYFVDRAEFGIPLKAQADANADDVAIDVRFQLCNDTFSLPPRTKPVSFSGE